MEGDRGGAGPPRMATIAAGLTFSLLAFSAAVSAQSAPAQPRATEAPARQSGTPVSKEGAAALAEAQRLNARYLALFEAGDYAAAEPVARNVLDIVERVLGPDHRATLTAVDHLASAHERQGEWAEAESLHRRALEGRERILGRDDPGTLSSLGSLAATYRAQGKHEEAEPLLRRALEAYDRTLGPDHAQTIGAVGRLAGTYRDLDRIAEVIPLEARMLASVERTLGPDDPAALRLASRLADLHLAQDNFAAAEPLRRRVLEARERKLGGDHPDTVAAVVGLAINYAYESRFAEAEPLFKRALQARERASGPDHEDTLEVVRSLAETYRAQGRPADAEPLYRRVLDARERTLGRDRDETLTAAGSLASLYGDQGRHAEAELLRRRALEARERTAGPDHRDTLAAVGDLASLYISAYRYAEAEPLAARMLAARERTLGRDHPDTLAAVGGLAAIYLHDGRFAEAEPLIGRVLDASEKAGREDADTLRELGNLAALYMAQDRWADAEPLLLRTLESLERVKGPDDPVTLNAVGNLAILYHEQGRHEEAETLDRRELDGQERTLGPDHPNTLAAVEDLARAYRDQGREAEAEPLLRRALESRERTLGRDHPRTLLSAGILAAFYQESNRQAEARPLFRRARKASERVRWRDDPETLISFGNLASLYAGQGRVADAEPLLRKTLTGSERVFGREHPNTILAAENLLLLTLEHARLPADKLASARLMVAGLTARQQPGDANEAMRAQQGREASSTAFRFALFGDAAWAAAAADERRRAALLPEAFAALQYSVASAAADRSVAEQAARRQVSQGNAALADVMRERQRLESEWSRLDADLAFAFAAGPDAGERPAAVRARREQVQARIAAIDARLRSEAPDYFALIAPAPVDVAAAQHLLGPDEAILLAVPSRFGTHVVALTRDAILWRRSGWHAGQVRDAVQRLRWDAGAYVTGSEEEMARLRALPSDGRASFDRTTAYALYREIVGPVSGLLAGKRRVYVAAGGALAALPFQLLVAAPPAGADNDPAALRATRWFGDEAALIHIPSIQSLALLRQEPGIATGTAFTGIGDPALEGQAAFRNRDAGPDPPNPSALFRAGRSRDGGPIADAGALRRLARLPGTAQELEAVRRTLGAPPASLLLAENATESNVRAADLSRTRILLFSTHGLTAAESSRFGIGEAGLVLTPPAEAREGDDGFLAASEVTTLSLDADWVILSACNTATGDGTTGAGLGPLARAFFYAGARNLLASHWPVSDEVAPVLITRTLALERGGTPRAEAFRQAMREIRLDASHDTAEDSWAHPFYWAPFVLIGDGGR